MRIYLVRWGIVVAVVAAAGALPAGGPQRINLSEMPEAVSTVKTTVYGDRDDPRTVNRGADPAGPARAQRS